MGTSTVSGPFRSQNGFQELVDGEWVPVSGGGSPLSLTTTGTSGPATLVGSNLNIPNYATGGGIQTIVIPRTSVNTNYVFDAPTQVGQTWSFALEFLNGIYGGFTYLLPSALTPGASNITFFGSQPTYDTYGNLVNIESFGTSSPSSYVMNTYDGPGYAFTYMQTVQITYIGQGYGYDVYLVNGYRLITGSP